MPKTDRTELQVAAVVGAVLGGVTGYLLSNLVESGGWLKILIWAIIVQSSSVVWFLVFGLFVRESSPRRFSPPWSVEVSVDDLRYCSRCERPRLPLQSFSVR
jgi:ATP/ADP translocase